MSEPFTKAITADYEAEVFKGLDGWRWRVTSTHNGQVVATSGEGYENRAHAIDMVNRLWPNQPTAYAAVDVIADEAAEAIDRVLGGDQ
jgi:uncharacterized protein YegP (UPF0339 family)